MSTLIEVEGLKKYFPLGTGLFSREKRVVHAVDGVNFNINKGETFSLVGESGCGKTTIGRLLLWLIEPTEGVVKFDGIPIYDLKKQEMRKLRRKMQIVFQDPYASLNPRKTIRQILSRSNIIHKLADKREIEEKISRLLELVGITPPETYIDRYPHEFSGGQRQRISIARVLMLPTEFIVLDEPVSSLDLSIRAQVLVLLRELQEKFRLSYLYITHDLSTTRSIANRVAVMYVGKFIELANADELYENPLHPYTKGILSATLIPNPRRTRARSRIILKGDVPTPINPPSGCRFHTRCPNRNPECAEKEPALIDVGGGHLVRCHQIG